MVKFPLALAVAALLQGAAAPPAFQPQGVWLFHTYAQRDGAPVCSELWEFRPDGRMLIESGAERVTKTYRIERDRDGLWIVGSILETNGAPDCTGAANPTPSRDEQRTYVLPMNGGEVMICRAPTRTSGGAPFVSGCYGQIVPADQAG